MREVQDFKYYGVSYASLPYEIMHCQITSFASFLTLAGL